MDGRGSRTIGGMGSGGGGGKWGAVVDHEALYSICRRRGMVFSLGLRQRLGRGSDGTTRCCGNTLFG